MSMFSAAVKNIDLTNHTFGNLKVLHLTTSDPHGGRRWVCLCSCGKTKIAFQSKLKSGGIKSCGDRAMHKRQWKPQTNKKKKRLELIAIVARMKKRRKEIEDIAKWKAIIAKK